MFLYRIFYGFCWLLALLPLRCLYLISDFIFVLVRYVVRYRYKVVMENLHNSFPEKTEKERRKFARQFYRFLCDLFIETIKVIHIDLPQMRRRFHYVNPEIFEDLYRKGKQVFGAAGHYGNWEWMASLEHTISYHHAPLYQILENKFSDKLFYGLRTKYGADPIPAHSVIRVLLQYMKENRLTIFGFMTDQSPGPEAQYWTTFLNQDTPVYIGIEKLAKRYNTAVVYYEIQRVKRGYYEVEVTLITENAAETADHEITDKHVQLLEQTIRRNPQYWLWSHKRWKHKRITN